MINKMINKKLLSMIRKSSGSSAFPQLTSVKNYFIKLAFLGPFQIIASSLLLSIKPTDITPKFSVT